MAEAGIDSSVGSRGGSYFTALAETQKGLGKAEVIHGLGPWRNRDVFEYTKLEWFDWFTN